MFIMDERDAKLNRRCAMIHNIIENEILHNALEAFKKNVALPIEINTEANEKHLRTDVRAGRLLRIFIQKTELRFYAEIKTNIPNITLAGVVLHTQNNIQLQHNILLVTRYVTPQLAEKLKENNIQFIDTAGNAYINQAPLYIYVKGNRLPELLRPVPVKRVFKPAGIKLIYAFLCDPGLENRPYREIAQIANVALGTVGWIMRDLRQMGHLIDMGKKGKRLIDLEILYNKWEIAYQEQLRPKLIVGRYQGTPGWWVNKHLDPQIGQWGGEVAAARLTQYLRPEIVTIYLDRNHLNNFLLENRLRKDPNGNTEILERFWYPVVNRPNDDIVHPLLIFTDLYETNDQRNRETAMIIHEKYIFQYLRKN